ncbi:hypothetical protein ACFFVB_06295 [Formosa undariae]|uniref:Right-handed parallel beta-helix repeat-containing protein n=1 Tax=Formosa undariae TaxID=1325436 RepID=A0ABV5EZS2_9FLAO
MKLAQYILILVVLFISNISNATEIKINSLKELVNYASKSSNVITMAPGVYQLTDYFTLDSMAVKHDRKAFQFIVFSGSHNVFKLDGVEIVVDNKLRAALSPPLHSNEFLINGANNVFEGLSFKYKGEVNAPGGAVLEVGGKDNTLKNVVLHVSGSFPYGYGDYLGKGKNNVVKHQKHSGLLITGFNTKLLACKVFMKSFGHAFFIQGGDNTYFKDCYAEGEIRSTDEMLAETSGPAFDNDFASIYMNYDGEKKIPSGYMKSLNECGFRTYSTGKVTAVNCVAKNMRVGFALAKVSLDNCEAIDCERGYYLNKAVTKNSRGDAKYGPLLYLVGDEPSQIDLTLTPGESEMKVHALATISGTGHEVNIKSTDQNKRKKSIPIMLGYGMPSSGEIASPLPAKDANHIKITNTTTMPIVVNETASDCVINTNGIIEGNAGKNIQIIKN